MEFPEPLKMREVVTVDISSPTMKRGTFMQVRIPKPKCSSVNPDYHLLEIEVSDQGVVTIHGTLGTPEIQYWDDGEAEAQS